MSGLAFRLNDEEQKIIRKYCDDLEITIVPFRFEGKSKRPNLISWEEYKTRRNTSEELELWLPNNPAFGIVAGKLACVDFDIIKDKDSEFYNQLHPKAIDFYNELISLHPSWSQETGSGGKHIIYETEEGFPVETRKIPDIPGLEIRGEKSLFIVAPSYHSSGNRYKTIRCPFKDGISLFPYSEFYTNKSLSIQSDSSSKKAYENLIDRGHLSEGSRNIEIASLAGLVYNKFANKPEFARDILFAINQYYASLGKKEPLSEKELLAIIKGQETKYHPKTEQDEQENKRKAVLFLHEIKDLEANKNAWIVEELIPTKGITVIYGAPGEGKSFIRSAIAIACARGKELFDKFPTKKSKVLLVDKDTGMYHDLGRFKDLGVDVENEKLDIAFYTIAHNFNVHDKKEIAELTEHIKEHAFDLVIFDTFRDIFFGDENSSQEVGEVIGFMKSLSALNVTTILVHHTKKNTEDDKKNPAKLARGSSALWGGVHSMLYISKSTNENTLSICHAKNKYGKPHDPILLNIFEDNGQIKGFSYAGIATNFSSKELTAQEKTEKEILKLFITNEMEVSREDIVAQATKKGCTINSINGAISGLCNNALIKTMKGKDAYFKLNNEA